MWYFISGDSITSGSLLHLQKGQQFLAVPRKVSCEQPVKSRCTKSSGVMLGFSQLRSTLNFYTWWKSKYLSQCTMSHCFDSVLTFAGTWVFFIIRKKLTVLTNKINIKSTYNVLLHSSIEKFRHNPCYCVLFWIPVLQVYKSTVTPA